MPACACVPPPCPGLQAGQSCPGTAGRESRGRGRFRAAPGPAPVSRAPREACPARACIGDCGAGACVPAAGKVALGARSVQLKRTSRMRGEQRHRPGLRLRFARFQRGLVDPGCPQPPWPPCSRPELCREERGSLLCVPSPPPLHPGGRMLHRAPVPAALLEAGQRDQALPTHWQHAADGRRAVEAGPRVVWGAGRRRPRQCQARGRAAWQGTAMPCARALPVGGERGPAKAGQELGGLAGATRAPAASMSLLRAGAGVAWGREVARPGSSTLGLGRSTARQQSGRQPPAPPTLAAGARAGAGRPGLAGAAGGTAARQGGCGQRQFPRPASFTTAAEAAVTRAERALDRGLASPAARWR